MSFSGANKMKINKTFKCLALIALFVLPSCGLTRPYLSSKEIALDPKDPTELKLVGQIEDARFEYFAALTKLNEFYSNIGMVQKQRWAKKELNNLEKTQPISFTLNGETILSNKKHSVPVNPTERELVEAVISWRTAYLNNLAKLAEYFGKKKDLDRQGLVDLVISRFFPDSVFMYLESLEVPPASLRPSKKIPLADQMYDRAMHLYEEGKKYPAIADYDKQRQALVLFKRLIRQYPNSTKIAKAAFIIAEIYKEYFHEYYLSALWYKRALDWDPGVPFPARFQLAVQLDFHLGQKAEALKYYIGHTKKEAHYGNSTRYAHQRIGELSKMLHRSRPRKNTPRKRPVRPKRKPAK